MKSSFQSETVQMMGPWIIIVCSAGVRWDQMVPETLIWKELI